MARPRRPRPDIDLRVDGLTCRFEPHPPYDGPPRHHQALALASVLFAAMFIATASLDFVDQVLLAHAVDRLSVVVGPGALVALVVAVLAVGAHAAWRSHLRVDVEVDHDAVEVRKRVGPVVVRRHTVPLESLNRCTVEQRTLVLHRVGDDPLKLTDHRAWTSDLTPVADAIEGARRRYAEFLRDQVEAARRADHRALEALRR